ncbi:hypothetical protein Tco_0599295 [Tanacetum coccineum]
MPSEHHIPLRPTLRMLQIGIKAKVIENQGILLVNADELPEMDPYEEVAKQGHTPPLLPAYVPDPIELDEHVPVYVPDPQYPKYHLPIDDDIQVEDHPYADDASPTVESPGHIAESESMEEDSIDYPDEHKDDDEDPEEDLEEDHTDYPVDREDGDDEPSDDDDDDDDTDDENEEPTKDEEEEEHLASADSFVIPIVDPVPSAGDIEVFETDESAPTPRSPQTRAPLGHRAAMIRMRDHIPEEDMPPRRRFLLTAPPPVCDVAESSAAAAARPPRGQYDFVDTVKAGQGLIRSLSHDARTIARVANKVEDVGYVRALQAFEHRMMTSIEEVNLRVSYQALVRRQESEDFYTQLHDARTDSIDIRLEIDVVRGQMTAYETELHERAEDHAVRQMMCTRVLEARAQIDMVEDTDRSGYHQKDRKPSQNDKTEHGMEKTVQNQGQKSKNAKVRVNTEESAVKPEPELKNTIECNLIYFFQS